MTQDINNRLVKFSELVPSKIPFVEGKLKGHQDRLNYSIVGPGVSAVSYTHLTLPTIYSV